MAETTVTPLDLSEADAEALHGTFIEGLLAKLPAIGTNANTTPSLAAQLANLIRHMISELDSNLRARKDGTLTIGVRWGRFRNASGTTKLFEGAKEQALTNNATNYVYIDATAGTPALTINTTGFPADTGTFIPIAEYVTSGGAIVTSDRDADRRDWLRAWIPPTAAALTGTPSTSILLDNDNAGAGADCFIKFERGSTNAEDACIQWDETNDRIVCRSQDSTLTRCPVDASALLIAGTTMVDSNGAAKVTSAVAGDGLTHASGVLAVNPDGTTLEISSDAVQIKDGGVSAAKLSNTVADAITQLVIPDASGATPQTITVQAKDLQGNNLNEVVYFTVGVFDDADGASLSADAEISVSGLGTLIDSVTADKELAVKTDANGQIELDIAKSPGGGTYYVIAKAGYRSKWLSCADIGTVVIS